MIRRNYSILFTIAILFFVVPVVAAADIKQSPEPYELIKTKEILSKRIIRNSWDPVYSGQIKSEHGLLTFAKSYDTESGSISIDFNKQMLIFGITDHISTRAFQFLKQGRLRSFVLDYIDTGIRYELRMLEEGKKYSYLQIFILDRIDSIPHISVKNLVGGGLSKVYE